MNGRWSRCPTHRIAHGHLAIHGNAAEDEILLAAGAERASCVVCVANSNAENVFTTLSTRELNQQARIVRRADADETRRKLQRAGDRRRGEHFLKARHQATSRLRCASQDGGRPGRAQTDRSKNPNASRSSAVGSGTVLEEVSGAATLSPKLSAQIV